MSNKGLHTVAPGQRAVEVAVIQVNQVTHQHHRLKLDEGKLFHLKCVKNH